MGAGTREGTKRSIGADRATSAAVVRLVPIGDDDLFHLQHGLHHSTRFFRAGIPHQLAQRSGSAAARSAVRCKRGLGGFARESTLLCTRRFGIYTSQTAIAGASRRAFSVAVARSARGVYVMRSGSSPRSAASSRLRRSTSTLEASARPPVARPRCEPSR